MDVTNVITLVDNMMSKMLTPDPEIKPEIALAWCINAKNTLENVNDRFQVTSSESCR